MCLVLDRFYGFSFAGLEAYFINRILRIYPPYWVACALSVLVMAAFGEQAAALILKPWVMPAHLADWIDSFVILTLPGDGMSRLVPPSWALRVEVYYYIAMGLVLGRGRLIAVGWLAASVLYHVYIGIEDPRWPARYFPIAAASLPFSLGAIAYHFRDAVPGSLRRSNALLALVTLGFAINLIAAPLALGSVLGPWRFYLNLLLVASLVALLSERRSESQRLRALDARLGDAAYPVYLIHMQVGLAVSTLGIVPAQPGIALFFASIVPILIVSWLMLRLVDDPIERARALVKRNFEKLRPSVERRESSA